jgi:class 3 adenylate cyclase
MADTTNSSAAAPLLARRLATILSADVAGYSRMMGTNEEATVRTLQGHRAVFESLLVQHHGRVFNTAGDAILAEFPSAVDAVRCAIEIQAALATLNERLPAEHKMLFRMGINLGDVVIQDDDLLGDGVNVASRIQAIAAPGGICIAGSVYDQIQNKLSLHFKPLGDQKFKNIGKPIRTFSVMREGEDESRSRPGVRRSLLVVLGAVALVVSGIWIYREHESQRAKQDALTAALAAEKGAVEQARHDADDQSRRAIEAENKASRVSEEAAKREAAARSRDQAASAVAPPAKSVVQAPTVAPLAKTSLNEVADQGRSSTQPAGAGGRAVSGSTMSKAPNPFDGEYTGEVCNAPGDASKKLCWSTALAIRDGAATAKWRVRRIGKPAYARITIAADGTVDVRLDGWKPNDGTPLTGTMKGRIEGSRIDADGHWANGLNVRATWTRGH